MAKIKIQSMNGNAGKETIYVDVDDEITAIIDKVQNAKGKVVALVLPKRAPVLQSIVNMKLLKRTADNAEKNLVLITSEIGLMPLAGAVGLHVASSPTSKPSIPSAPAGPDDEPEDAEEPLSIVDGNTSEDSDFNRKDAANKPIGELAAGAAAADVDDSIDMADDTEEPADDAAAAPVPTPKKNSRLRVPNFDSFRKRLALGVLGLIVLIVGWVFAFKVLPSATVSIKTDSSTITTNLNLVLDTTAKALDAPNNIMPAVSQSQQKTSSQQVNATGQQNNGQKAAGSATFSAKECFPNLGQPDSIPAGTSISANGLTYVVQETVKFNSSGHITGSGQNTCATYNALDNTDIAALKGGANYNTSNANFSVSGRSDASASGSASGGTDNITKIVTQSDIDGATSKIAAADSATIKQQLTSNLQAKGLQAIPTTFLAGDPAVNSSAKAGDAADTVTVTAVTTYTMLGVQKTDLRQLVTHNVDDKIDKSKQVILDDGVANATFTQANPGTPTGANVTMQAKSEAGPQLDAAKLKTQLAGKKSNEVKTLIKQTPGVTDVDVQFSPFWVNVVPKNADKVTIKIVKAGS